MNLLSRLNLNWGGIKHRRLTENKGPCYCYGFQLGRFSREPEVIPVAK